ncbi:uncharacterized protein N7458_000695 [Penicillium daleae]|uniref:Uncharacterized protein n=1 Tax=Penicillium daleae TaxID=63821 RepID=A0AAD6CJC1_9EURO|nr:uncharacterized protein N7458_000695 [Penicillium daleae]KAJ5465009.1 hypothetical protein N7458_000695 [Penicillium daleae]
MVQEPRIVGGGGIPPGLVRDSMAEMVNLVPTPTIFQLCGIDETFSHNGKSLLPAILEDRDLQKAFFSEAASCFQRSRFSTRHRSRTTPSPSCSTRTHDWWARLYEPAELNGLRADPIELHNPATDQ